MISGLRAVIGSMKRRIWQSDVSVVYSLPLEPLAAERPDDISFIGLNGLLNEQEDKAIALPEPYESFRQQGDSGLVAFVHSEIAGWMWIRKGPFLEGVGFGTAEIPAGVNVVRHVEVYPAFRSKGVGRSLLTEGGRRFRLRTRNHAIAFVNCRNTASIKAFDAAGYIVEGRIRFHEILGRPLKVVIRPDKHFKS